MFSRNAVFGDGIGSQDTEVFFSRFNDTRINDSIESTSHKENILSLDVANGIDKTLSGLLNTL